MGDTNLGEEAGKIALPFLLSAIFGGGGGSSNSNLEQQSRVQAELLQIFKDLGFDFLNESRTQRDDDKAARGKVADFNISNVFGTDLGRRVFGEDMQAMIDEAAKSRRDMFVNEADKQFLSELGTLLGLFGQAGSGSAPANLANINERKDSRTQDAWGAFGGGIMDFLGTVLNDFGNTPTTGGAGGTTGDFNLGAPQGGGGFNPLSWLPVGAGSKQVMDWNTFFGTNNMYDWMQDQGYFDDAVEDQTGTATTTWSF